MNPLDIIIIAVMAFLLVRGIFRGFIREVTSLAGLVLGILLASRFQPQMSDYLKSHIPSTPYLPLISFAVIFVVILISCNLLGWFLKQVIKKALLGWADRVLGAGFAMLKGLILVYLVIILLTFFHPGATTLIAKSKMARLVTISSQSLARLISPDVYKDLMGKIIKKPQVKKELTVKEKGSEPKR
ncbi:CvpA family protein [Thermodesulfobacteriota bacterium]